MPKGFEIYRVYLGEEYRAMAVDGKWQLLTLGKAKSGLRFSSLNQLSNAIGAKTENAWPNWYFTNQDGKRVPINTLRP